MLTNLEKVLTKLTIGYILNFQEWEVFSMKELIGRKVKELRLQYGQTQEVLARQMGVTKEFISMVESGKRLPGLENITRLAKVFHRDASYFMRDEEEPFAALFRVDNLGAVEREALDRAAKFCENYAFLEKETGQLPQLPPEYHERPGASKSLSALIKDAERMAESEWSRLGLGDEPMKDIFNLIESQGVHVIRQDMGSTAFDGAFLYSRENGAFIIINSSRPLSRQVFTAAHEYCHCLRHRRSGILIDRNTQENYLQSDKSPVERFADLFASAFLMPKRAIDKAVRNLNKHVGPEEVIQLKRYFGVSYQAMVFRLINVNVVPKTRNEEFLRIRPNALEGSIFGVSEDTPAPEGLPERYVRLALDAYLMGKVTVSRLAELLNTDVFELKKALAESRLKRGRGAVEKHPA